MFDILCISPRFQRTSSLAHVVVTRSGEASSQAMANDGAFAKEMTENLLPEGKEKPRNPQILRTNSQPKMVWHPSHWLRQKDRNTAELPHTALESKLSRGSIHFSVYHTVK